MTQEPQPAAPQTRTWLTVHYEGGNAQITAHAIQPFGTREATVHVDLAADPTLAAALEPLLAQATEDLLERAQDAASVHRTLARNAGESYAAPLKYVGTEVAAEQGTFSDPGVMGLPVHQREQAVKRTQAAMHSGGQ